MIGSALIWGLLVMCLGLSFLLSGMEAGVFALSRVRIRQQMRAGRRSAKLLHEFLENPENFLWTIFVGNTAANFFIFGWAIFLLHEALPQRRLLFVLLFAAVVFLFYTLFDLLPKMLFRTFPNRLCLALAQNRPRAARSAHEVVSAGHPASRRARPAPAPRWPG